MLLEIDSEAYPLYSTPNLTGSPERNLWMSVLERAILDYVGNDPKEIQEASDWLFDGSDGENDDSEQKSPYSFPWVCEQLDLNPTVVADIIRSMPKRGSRRIAPWYFMKDEGKALTPCKAS